MNEIDISTLKNTIRIESTEVVVRTVKLPEGQYACPFCEFSSGKIVVGHRDFGHGLHGTGPIYHTCGRCEGTQSVIICKDCGELIANTGVNRNYHTCMECRYKKAAIDFNKRVKDERLKSLVNF